MCNVLQLPCRFALLGAVVVQPVFVAQTESVGNPDSRSNNFTTAMKSSSP